MDKQLLKSGEYGYMFPLKNLMKYFDRGTNEYKYQENIEFKLKIKCEKLDEIAKDQNNESGVEDTDEEAEISKDEIKESNLQPEISYFAIRSQLSSKTLDVDTGDPNKIQMWDYHGGDNQLWYWDPNGVAIRSKKYPNKVIDLHMDDFNKHGWGKIYLHEWNGGKNQKWRLEGDRLISHFKNVHLDILPHFVIIRF